MLRHHASRLAFLAAAVTLAALVALTVSASRSGNAAYPGANGRIAYAYGASYGYGGGSIWSANPDGGSPTTLTSGTNDNSPTYSPDGGRVAFERDLGIAVMNADGAALTQLINGSGTTSSETKFETEYETSENPPRTIPVVRIYTVRGKWHSFGGPSFSPDGKQLAISEGIEDTAFTTICAVETKGEEECLEYSNPDAFFDYEYECLTCSSGIITIDSKTGAKTGVVTTAPKGSYDYQPAYSVDGKIAFVRSMSPGRGLFVVDAPGGSPTQVASGYNLAEPDFSPDGTKIAFSHGGELAIVGAAGGPLTVLPTPTPSDAFSSAASNPVFSPDGATIAFERTIFFPGKWDYGINTIGTDGSGLTKVIDHGSSPSWQPLAVSAPPQTPPRAIVRKGRIRLNKKNQAVIGAIFCGSSPCALKVMVALLKIRKPKAKRGKHPRMASGAATSKKPKKRARSRTYKIKGMVPRGLAPGQKGKVKVRVGGRALVALRKAGKGASTVKIRVTDGLGVNVLTMKSNLLPPRKHKKPKRHGKHRKTKTQR